MYSATEHVKMRNALLLILLLTAVCFTVSSYVFPQSGVDTNYFTDNRASGGEGGSPFTFIRANNGAILTRIRAWKSDWRITCVQVWMSDGSYHQAGIHKYGSPAEFRFQAGELITLLNVQASDAQSSVLRRRRLGAIWFQTSRGRSWGIFSNDLSSDARYWPDVGSGICCGIFGRSGDAVDSLGFAMLRPVDRAILNDVTYPNLNLEVVANTPETVAHQTFQNGLDLAQTFTLRGSRSVTVKRSWSLAFDMSTTLSVSVTAGIPEVASASTEVSWTVGFTSTYQASESSTETRQWEWPLTCPPHRRIFGRATMYADSIDTAYEATMELHLSNGRVFTYIVRGTYEGLNARSGTVTVNDLGPFNG